LFLIAGRKRRREKGFTETIHAFFFLSARETGRIEERGVNNKPPLPSPLILLMGEREKLRLPNGF
jgi:hypothetical protein